MLYPDICPTLIGLTGVGAEVPAVVEGINYASYILQKTKQYPKSQYFLGEVVAPEKQMGFRGIRTKEYKLAYYRKKPSDPVTLYLFNIVTDLFEMHNLYDTDPATVKKPETELEQWFDKTKDPFRLR